MSIMAPPVDLKAPNMQMHNNQPIRDGALVIVLLYVRLIFCHDSPDDEYAWCVACVKCIFSAFG